VVLSFIQPRRGASLPVPNSLRPQRSRYFIDSVGRGFEIMRIVAESPEPATISEIAQRTGLVASTVLRFVETLRDLDFLAEGVVSGTYQPGPAAIRTGYLALQTSPLREIALPILSDLYTRLSDTVNMAVLDGRHIVNVARFKQIQMRNINVHEGSRIPAHCTALGKAMLAQYDPGEVAALYEGYDFPVFTETTTASLSLLQEALAEVRVQGFALQQQELVAGHQAQAVPVFDSAGSVCAAIGTVSAQVRSTEALASEREELTRAAEAIGAVLPAGFEA